MYKTFAALTVAVFLVSSVIMKIDDLLPVPHMNEVIAEKPAVTVGGDQAIGGQAAIVLPADLTESQHAVLNTAYAMAKADGHKNPELVQTIILQESKAGAMDSYKVAGDKHDQYYGLGQIKIAAAHEVMAAFPKLWGTYKFQTRTDDELKANLILNKIFNIDVTSKYLKLLQTRYGYKGRELINAYNRGPEGVKSVDSSYPYAIQAEQKYAMAKRQGKL